MSAGLKKARGNDRLDDNLDLETQRRIILAANDIAGPVWLSVEKAYAKGQTLAQAKQSVLDEEVTRLASTTEEVVLDRLVQLVMQTPGSALSPYARQRHRKIVLERLLEPYRQAGGAEPGGWAMWLYRRFGIVPSAVKAFWAARGERPGRVL
jgi:hypothetical protein